jgi:surfeit locus 1 family protein
MLQRLAAARLIGPAIMTALAFALLMGLGAWQMNRKAWKENLISHIEARTKAAPISLIEMNNNSVFSTRDPGSAEYWRVVVRGRFMHDKERYFYAPDPELGPGVNVTTPLEITGTQSIVFVNRGYVPDSRKDPASRQQSQIAGEVEVTGLLREQSQPGRFVPENDAKNNMWYWRDVNGLAASAFPDGNATVLPFVVDQEASTTPGDGPKGGTTIVTLSNRHLEYAITWYGLAATLVSIFAVYASGRLKAQKT